MLKIKKNKRKSWFYPAKIKNVRKKIKRLCHKTDRILTKIEIEKEISER
jgi:hypothetical protein